jgi:hypothetical protein
MSTQGEFDSCVGRDPGPYAESLIRRNLEQAKRLGELEEALKKRDEKHREDERRIADEARRVEKREDLIVLLQQQVQEFSTTEWAELEEAQAKLHQSVQAVQKKDEIAKQQRKATEEELRVRRAQLKHQETTVSQQQLEFDHHRSAWLEKLGKFFAQQVEKLQSQVGAVNEQKTSFLKFKCDAEQRVRDCWGIVHQQAQSMLQQQQIGHSTLAEVSHAQLQSLESRLQQADAEHANYVRTQAEMEEVRREQLAVMAEQQRQQQRDQQAYIDKEASQIAEWRRENERRENDVVERTRELRQARERQASDVRQHFGKLEERRLQQAKADALLREQLAEQQALQQQIGKEANEKLVALQCMESALAAREKALDRRESERGVAEETLSMLASKVTGMLQEMKHESIRLREHSSGITAEVGAVKLARDELRSQAELAREAKVRVFEHQEALSRRIRMKQVEEEKRIEQQMQLSEQQEKVDADLNHRAKVMGVQQAALAEAQAALREQQMALRGQQTAVQKREEEAEAREERIVYIKEAIKEKQSTLMSRQAFKAEELQQWKEKCIAAECENGARAQELDEQERALKKLAGLLNKREQKIQAERTDNKVTRVALKRAEQQVHEQARAAEVLLKENVSRATLQQQKKNGILEEEMKLRQEELDETTRQSDLALAEKEAAIEHAERMVHEQRKQLDRQQEAWERKYEEKRQELDEEVTRLSASKREQQTQAEKDARELAERKSRLEEEARMLGALKDKQLAGIEGEARQLGALKKEQQTRFEEEERGLRERKENLQEEARLLSILKDEQQADIEKKSRELITVKKEQSAEAAKNIARKSTLDQRESNLDGRSKSIDEAAEVLRKKQAAHKNRTAELRTKLELLQEKREAFKENESKVALLEKRVREDEEHCREQARQVGARSLEVEKQSDRLEVRLCAHMSGHMQEECDQAMFAEMLQEQQMMLNEDCLQAMQQRCEHRRQQQGLEADRKRQACDVEDMRLKREEWEQEATRAHQKVREAELRTKSKERALKRWREELERERDEVARLLQQNKAHNHSVTQNDAKRADQRRELAAAQAKLELDSKLEELACARRKVEKKGKEYDALKAKTTSDGARLHARAREMMLNAEALTITANKAQVVTQVKAQALNLLQQELLLGHEQRLADAAEQRAREKQELDTLTQERMGKLHRDAEAQLVYLSAVDERTCKRLRSLSSKGGMLKAQEEELRQKADVLARLEQVLQHEKARSKKKQHRDSVSTITHVVSAQTATLHQEELHQEELQRKEEYMHQQEYCTHQQLAGALRERELEAVAALNQAVAAAESAHEQDLERIQEQHTSALKCALQLQKTEMDVEIKRAMDAKDAHCASMVLRGKDRHAAALGAAYTQYKQEISTKMLEFAAAMRAKEDEHEILMKTKDAEQEQLAENEGGLAAALQAKEEELAATLAAKEREYERCMEEKDANFTLALEAKEGNEVALAARVERKEAQLHIALQAKEEEHAANLAATVRATETELAKVLQAKDAEHEAVLAAKGTEYERYAEAMEAEMVLAMKAKDEAHGAVLVAKEAQCEVCEVCAKQEKEAKRSSPAHPPCDIEQLSTPDMKPSTTSSQMSLGERASESDQPAMLVVAERRVLELGKRRLDRERQGVKLRDQQVRESVTQLESAKLAHQQHCNNIKVLTEKKMASIDTSRMELEARKASFKEHEQSKSRSFERVRLELESDTAKAKATEEMANQRWEDASRLERTVSMQLFEAEKQLHAAEAQRRLVLDLGDHLWQHMQLVLDGQERTYQKQATIHRVLSESTEARGLHRDHGRALELSQGLLSWRAQLVQQSESFRQGHADLQHKLGVARQQVEDLNQRLSTHGKEWHTRVQKLAADRLEVQQRVLLLDEREVVVAKREVDIDRLRIAEDELGEREERWRLEEERLQRELDEERERAEDLGVKLEHEQAQCEGIRQRLDSMAKAVSNRSKFDSEVDEREQRLVQWADQLRAQSDRLGDQSELLLERALGYNDVLEQDVA